MSKRSKQWYSMTDKQLGMLVGQGTYPEAAEAWQQVRSLRKAGHEVAIYYSEFSGFRVIDENDSEQFKLGLSICTVSDKSREKRC